MQALPRLRSGILERPDFLDKNISGFRPSHNFGLLTQFHQSLLLRLTGFFSGPAYASVCTSTESTAGRARTIGAQLSPASADAYTCAPLGHKSMPHWWSACAD